MSFEKDCRYGNKCFLNQYIMFADSINEAAKENEAIQKRQDIAASRVARSNAMFKLLDLMLSEFTATDLRSVMAEKDLSPESSRTYLSRMLQRELIIRTPEGYRKIPL
ncbi:MAG: hypothetical protein IKP36_14325 [Bacteroidaceae bacterium]|nr:hypothetical protein [Bacteroidaceae bacterium]